MSSPEIGMALTDEHAAVRVFHAEAAEAAATEAVIDIRWMTGRLAAQLIRWCVSGQTSAKR
jgi:hypothetical protein